MIKLDTNKAFCYGFPEYLLELMAKGGFGTRWNNSLSVILKTSSTTFL